MTGLTDADLNRMRTDTENNFVERKTVSDKGGWLRTAVAFANSTEIGYPAVLFVGVNNDGSIENVAPGHDWEKQQKTVTEQLNRAFPPFYFRQKILRDQGREFLAVIIPGSPQRPHFTGKAYIRVGPETKEASEEQFGSLIAQRSSKVYEILKWKGRTVTVEIMARQPSALRGYTQSKWAGIVEDCNEFWVSVVGPSNQCVILTLSLVDLSFDTAESRLKLLSWQS